MCLVSNFGCLRNVSVCRMWNERFTKKDSPYLCRVTFPLSLSLHMSSKWWLLRIFLSITWKMSQQSINSFIIMRFNYNYFFVHLDHWIVERWFSAFFGCTHTWRSVSFLLCLESRQLDFNLNLGRAHDMTGCCDEIDWSFFPFRLN